MPDENDIVYNTYGINLIGIVQAFFERIFGGGSAVIESFFSLVSLIWNIYSIIAILFSLLFFAGFVYAKIRHAQLGELIAEMLRSSEEEWARAYGGEPGKNNKWTEIEQHVLSDNPNDWRLAIIEADIMLDEMLINAGYVGNTIGERLKTANVTSFKTIRDAWDAHMVRNQIAHAGSDFVLTKRMAQETLLKYERVFREFNFI